jgi:hypothetical protein
MDWHFEAKVGVNNKTKARERWEQDRKYSGYLRRVSDGSKTVRI